MYFKTQQRSWTLSVMDNYMMPPRDINTLKQRKWDTHKPTTAGAFTFAFKMFIYSPVFILSNGRDSTPRNLHPPPLTDCLSQLTALTKSIISTRGRAISQQGHQDAAAEVALCIYLFIYLFPRLIMSFIKWMNDSQDSANNQEHNGDCAAFTSEPQNLSITNE